MNDAPRMAPAAADRAAALVRPEVLGLHAYHVAKAAGRIKLDAMENPYPLPDAVRDRVAAAARAVDVNRYPDGGADAVKTALRDAYAIDPSFGLVLGNGSDELITILTSALARPGSAMLAVEPSFVMYRMNAVYAGMRYVGVPLRQDFSLDADAMLGAIEREKPAIVFLAYPNNPTGNLFDTDVIEQIVAATPGLVVIDEAYQAFAEASFLPRIGEYTNVALLRTVSKVGMAGLRLGYAIADVAWTREFDKLRPPYNLNVFTQAVAPVLLAERELLATQAAEIRAQRALLEAQLARLPGVSVYPTRTNFVLVRVPDAGRWFARLLEAGILVKNVDAWHPLLAQCLRITVGTPRENEVLLAALKAIA